MFLREWLHPKTRLTKRAADMLTGWAKLTSLALFANRWAANGMQNPLLKKQKLYAVQMSYDSVGVGGSNAPAPKTRPPVNPHRRPCVATMIVVIAHLMPVVGRLPAFASFDHWSSPKPF